jgi:hypothetical protein
MFRSRTEDRLTMSCWRLAVASPHSAISAMVRPQPVQTLEFAFRVQMFVHGDGERSVIYLASYPCSKFLLI